MDEACKENVKKSCKYRYFTRPGLTCKITHKLSSSNLLGEFCHWFRMSLAKVEELTTILIDCGYITQPRSHRCRKVFREHSELLVMSALYKTDLNKTQAHDFGGRKNGQRVMMDG